MRLCISDGELKPNCSFQYMNDADVPRQAEVIVVTERSVCRSGEWKTLLDLFLNNISK